MMITGSYVYSWWSEVGYRRDKMTAGLGMFICTVPLYIFHYTKITVVRPSVFTGNCVEATQFPRKYGRSNYAMRRYFLGNIVAIRKYCRACAGLTLSR